ncbi:hypothetical protein [Cyanobium sp. ATX 6F1]|uniref:hypothetical protein n=1 Tax=unclassified Cyanobium TaxID=2627006 RepID=UPI0020CEE197|nr:hypothetical protein [Cyanobium sp. ATX 6F1]MCP9917475.1 hypothetical protein [Cyanobium sp. ATX 6F1]
MIESASAASLSAQQPLLDRQALATLIAAVLLILIPSFTNDSYGDLPHFGALAINDKIGVGLHVAAVAAVFGDVELATRLRHRARNREVEARERAAEREQRQNRALRAGALFLLEPNSLYRRFLAYIATELAS